MNISKLNESQKINFLIFIAKEAMKYMKDNQYFDLIKESIDECEKWISNGEYSGEYFYEILDNEENGLAMLQYEDENSEYVDLWNCIINAVAYISRKAYESEGVRYFPEPILLVSDEVIEDSVECLIGYNCEEREFVEEKYIEYTEKNIQE